jgi:hypothetical protein
MRHAAFGLLAVALGAKAISSVPVATEEVVSTITSVTVLESSSTVEYAVTSVSTQYDVLTTLITTDGRVTPTSTTLGIEGAELVELTKTLLALFPVTSETARVSTVGFSTIYGSETETQVSRTILID